jgi:hypothetical protein
MLKDHILLSRHLHQSLQPDCRLTPSLAAQTRMNDISIPPLAAQTRMNDISITLHCYSSITNYSVLYELRRLTSLFKFHCLDPVAGNQTGDGVIWIKKFIIDRLMNEETEGVFVCILLSSLFSYYSLTMNWLYTFFCILEFSENINTTFLFVSFYLFDLVYLINICQCSLLSSG